MDNKLNIQLQKDSIVITIDSLGEDFQKIKAYVLKNFKEYNSSTDKIIIPPNLLASKDEIAKRLKLIKWFIQKSNLLEKNQILARKILKSYEQKIEISFELYKLNQDVVSIYLNRYKNDILVLKIQNEFLPTISNIILNFLKRQCNPKEILKFDKDNREIYFNTKSETFANSLSLILQRENIIGKNVVFIYDKEYVNSILKNVLKTKKINSAKEYILKLRKAFETLQIDKNEKDLTLIKVKYLKLVKIYHPDRYYEQNNVNVIEYKDKFLQIKEAYEIIKEFLQKIHLKKLTREKRE